MHNVVLFFGARNILDCNRKINLRNCFKTKTVQGVTGFSA